MFCNGGLDESIKIDGFRKILKTSSIEYLDRLPLLSLLISLILKFPTDVFIDVTVNLNQN